MNRYIYKGIYAIACVCVCFMLSACEHKELCYHHPHDARVRINVDWSQFDKQIPTGMTVMVYPNAEGEAKTLLTNTTSHTYVNLPVGVYNSLVYNQSPSEYGSVSFRGMDKYDAAEVYANATRSSWYKTRGEEEKLCTEPEWIGTDRAEGMEVTEKMVEVAGEQLLKQGRDNMPDYVIGTHIPRNIIYTITVKVHIKGIHNLRSARASLSGLAEGYLLGQGKVTDNEVTQLLENWTKEIDAMDPTKGTITAKITCFGLPGNHVAQAEENELKLSILLVDNKTVLDFPFKVGDKFGLDLGAEVNLQLNMSLELGIDTPLPDVKPEGGSAGGFNATVDDWGDEEDYEVAI